MRTESNASTQMEKAGKATLASALEGLKPKLSQVLEGTGLTINRFIRMCTSQVREIPALSQCDPNSVLECCFKAAARGWEPGSALGLCYFIPFKDTATFVSGYKGLLDQVYNSGMMDFVRVKLVYKGDPFQVVEGSKAELVHEPDMERANHPDNEITHAYCVWKLKGSSECQWNVMTKLQIDAIRSQSKGKNSLGWTDHYSQMALKSVLRRATKMMPMSVMPRKFMEELHEEEEVEFGRRSPADAAKPADFDVLPSEPDVKDNGVSTPEPEKKPRPVAAKKTEAGGAKPAPTSSLPDEDFSASDDEDFSASDKDFPEEMWDKRPQGSTAVQVDDLIVMLNMKMNRQSKAIQKYLLAECGIEELLGEKDELKLQKLAAMLDDAEKAGKGK